jgi:hypothetical protein
LGGGYVFAEAFAASDVGASGPSIISYQWRRSRQRSVILPKTFWVFAPEALMHRLRGFILSRVLAHRIAPLFSLKQQCFAFGVFKFRSRHSRVFDQSGGLL